MEIVVNVEIHALYITLQGLIRLPSKLYCIYKKLLLLTLITQFCIHNATQFSKVVHKSTVRGVIKPLMDETSFERIEKFGLDK